MTSITKMIRADHTHVMATFHKYEKDTPPRVKKGLVDTLCLAIEVHAKLEEEIFYPALREVFDHEVLRKSEPEHLEMKNLIAQLRGMEAQHPAFDRTVFQLMQHVIHHVADEETVLLPEAETRLAGELADLGARMTKRRLELVAPKTPELASAMGRSVSGTTVLLALGALVAGGLLLARRGEVSGAVKHARRLMWERRMLSRARGLMPEPVKGMLPHPMSLFLPKKAKSLLR
jgi:hypothetical protein